MRSAQPQQVGITAAGVNSRCGVILRASIEIDPQIGVAVSSEQMWAVSIEAKHCLADRSSSSTGAGYCGGRCCRNIDCVRIHKCVEKQQTGDFDRIFRLALNFCLLLCGDLRLLN